LDPPGFVGFSFAQQTGKVQMVMGGVDGVPEGPACERIASRISSHTRVAAASKYALIQPNRNNTARHMHKGGPAIITEHVTVTRSDMIKFTN